MEKNNKSKNDIGDRSYFIRRLRKSGWAVDSVVDKFSEKDKRSWMVVVSRNNDNVFITHRKDRTFHFYDGLQFFDNSNGREVNRATESMEVIATILVDAGINEKHPFYGRKDEPTTEDASEESDE